MKTKSLEVSYDVADVGYGYLKYIDGDGNVRKVKAVIAEAGESFTGKSGVDVFSVDGVDYVVGDDVYKLGRKPITANEDTARASNIAYKVLALYGLIKGKRREGQVVLVTGLPFQNLDESGLVKEIFERSHALQLNGKDITLDISNAVIVSQGLGSFYSLVRQRGSSILKKIILLVDLGFRTINYLPINNGAIDPDTVKTNRDLGIQDAYKKIADAVNLEFKGNYKFYDVDDLLDHGVPTQNIDSGIVYVPIGERQYVKDAFTVYAKEVWTDILDKYGDKYREGLEEVVFSGGTAERVKLYLEANRKHYSTFIEDAQDVQVLGYADIANKLQEGA